jgi:peptidoglycan/LPS O-acetylase OafA/YrhL
MLPRALDRNERRTAPSWRWRAGFALTARLQVTLGAAASLAVAYLSYELFGKRFLRLKQLFATDKAPQRLAAGGAAEP